MIPAEKNTHQVVSTLGGEIVAMDIDQDAFQHVIRMLIGQYSNVPFAIIREYATNAWDSHVEAGNPMPIQVILPTHKAPFLRIKDFGVGLNADDIRNIYSKLGKSTKTQTNEQTGSLGIGAKSGLAYANQFTVVGIKGGILTSVNVSLDDDGVGSMTIVDEIETDSANGVEIIVPVKAGDIERFEVEATKLFRYWPAGRVLVDGLEPERYSGLQVTESVTLLKGERHRDQHGYVRSAKNYVVMAGVPYPIDTEHFTFDLPEAYSIVAEVPNGSVHFTPSREHLEYTKRTRAVLEQIQEDLKQGLIDSVTSEIEAAPSMPEALRVALKWREALPKLMRDMAFEYRKVALPDSIEAPESGVFLVADGERQTDYHGKNMKVGFHSRMRAIDLTMVPDAIWVYGFCRTFTPTVKKKLWKHFDDLNREYPPNFIMCMEKPKSPWIPPANIIDWTPIDAIKLPRINQATGRTMSGRIPGSYDLYMVSGDSPVFMEDVPGDDIDAELPVRYIVATSYRGRGSAQAAAKRLAKIEDEFSLVLLTNNRIARFNRLFPDAQSYFDVMKEYGQTFLTMLSPIEIEAVSIQNARLTDLDKLPHHTGIADPEIKRAKRLLHYRPAYIARITQMFRVFDQVEIHPPEAANPLDKYPLYDPDRWYWHSGVDHATLRQHGIVYLNAVYQELYANA